METNHGASTFTVKITPNDRGNPPGKLADAEVHSAGDSVAAKPRSCVTPWRVPGVRANDFGEKYAGAMAALSRTGGLPLRCMLFTLRRDPIPRNLFCVEVRDG